MMPPSPVPGSSLRPSIQAIDDANPLRIPWHFNQGHIGPRLDRLDAKSAYLVSYIEYLEHRIAGLEARLGPPHR